MNDCRHTSDIRLAKRMWLASGGEIVPVSGTGEVRYLHPYFVRPLRANDRRLDVPAKLMTRINQLAQLSSSHILLSDTALQPNLTRRSQ